MNKDLTEAEIGYIAGLVDGEGCLRISKRIIKNRHTAPQYVAEVQVSNSNKEVLEWFKSKTGIGKIRKLTGKNRKSHWKNMYRWQLSNKEDISQFLKTILSVLKIKQEQALVILHLKREQNPISKEIRDFRESLYQEIKRLNKKGVGT